MKAFLALVAFFLPLMGIMASVQATKDRMKGDLDVIRNIFDVQYAPKEWKYNYSQWSLDEQIEKAKTRVQEITPITTKGFQKIVHDFFNSTKDYHVTVRFWSTESAKLPFLVKGAEGKYFISHVEEDKLSPLLFQFSKGDELVTFGGRPTQEVVEELLKSEFRSANPETDRAMAEIYLTQRTGALGHQVPKGPIMIGVKSQITNKVQNYQLIWNYTPEKITNGMNPLEEVKARKKKMGPYLKKEDFLQGILGQSMLSPVADVMDDILRVNMDSKDLPGAKVSFIPELGRVWWTAEKDKTFHAYIYENEDHKLIGYVRIPDYIGFDAQVEEFASIIKQFEERTDALVIDQVNNFGGLLYYAYALASLLTEQPLYTPKHQMMISQVEVGSALLLLSVLEKVKNDQEAKEALQVDSLLGLPVTHQFVQFIINYCNFIIDEWDSGHKLTRPHYLLGIDQINPHPTVRYTKPILFLVNELDLSCADFIPAILQDNKRATLLGTRTGGAGGYIKLHTFSNYYGISFFTCTGSIAERIDQNPIENLGVKPDIEYVITESDIQGNYSDYAAAINQAVSDLLEKKEPDIEEKEGEVAIIEEPKVEEAEVEKVSETTSKQQQGRFFLKRKRQPNR